MSRPAHVQTRSWPAEPCPAQPMSVQFVSRTAHREPSQAHRNPWLVKTKVTTAYVQPGPWPSKIIARHRMPSPFYSQTKPNPPQPLSSPNNAQTSQCSAQPLVSPALARGAHDHTITWPAQTFACPGQYMSSAYHRQHSPWTVSPWPAQPFPSPSYGQHNPCQHQTTSIRGHDQAIPTTGQAISRSDHGMASSATLPAQFWPGHGLV
jgi:hypothetical protein